MKPSALVHGLALVAALASACTTAPDTPPGSTDLSLRGGDEVRVENSNLRVIFARVAEDSRCPVDVTCTWAGNAKIEVGISVGMGPTHALLLNSGVEPQEVLWNGQRVTLLRVEPQRRAGRTIPFGTYRITVRLTPE